jgi:TonB-linked SusC/RagA family outer membrane protein
MTKLDSKHLTARPGHSYKRLKVLFSFLCLFISTAVFAQQTIRGKVTSVDGLLNNVTVSVKGTANSTQTDANGEYSITAKPNDVLVFTSVGFNPQEISVNNQTTIDVRMSASSQMMSDVVVVGYGTQKRSDVTGSVSSVPKNRLTQLPVTNVLHAIEGSVAGVNVTQTSSVPGSSATVLVRGQNSIGSGINTGPYIVVDGIPFTKTGGGTNDINPNDIASIEILKDASATAIYGVNGANGVILITTKRGTSGKATIRYNGYTGFDNFAHWLDPMSPQQYVQKYADYKAQVPSAAQTVLPNNYEIANYNANKTIDWLKEATQQGLIQDHNLSVSGGTKDVRYYVSGDYMKQKGAVKGYQYHRVSIRSNLDFNITDFLSVGTTLYYANNNYDGGRANFYLAAAMSPYGTEYTSTGAYEVYPMNPEQLYKNPLLGLNMDRTDRSSNLTGNGYAELKLGGILKGLKYRLNGGYTYIPTRIGTYEGASAGNTVGGTAYSRSDETNSWVIENILSYTKDFGAHHIDFTGLYSAEERAYFRFDAGSSGFINDQNSFNNLGAGANTAAPYSYRDQYNLVSQMGRLNYTYMSRYLVTVTARRDGASVMGGNTNKFGVFPSVALGWNISNEDFMKGMNVFNALKLRGSYGKAGNEAIGVYKTITTESTNRYPFNGSSMIGVLASNLGNGDLHWETSKTLNVGVDFGILRNRINGSIDVYSTDTKGLILTRNLPIITGYSNILDNLGETKNHGVEVSLNTQNIISGDFKWETNIVFARNKNKIVDLYGDHKSDLGNRWFIGQPIGVIYDYKMVGVWQVGEDPAGWDPGAKPGDLKFADLTKDGKVTADDKVILGQTSPKWIGGLTNTFHYRNFHLNVFIQTNQGAMKNNVTLTYADEAGRMNIPVETGYWTSTNKSQTRPSLAYTNTRGYGYPSDNSFTRIKDVTLSYVFSQKLLDKMRLSSFTIYASGRNLHTFTNWIGWDPENNYSFRGSGDWTNNYPLTREIVFGLNVSLR